MPGWPARELAESQDSPFARHLGRSVAGVDFRHQGRLAAGPFVDLFEEVVRRFGPFVDTTSARRPDGALDLTISSTDGLLQIMGALAAVLAEGGAEAAFAKTLGDSLLMPLGLTFDPSAHEDAQSPEGGRGIVLPIGAVPTARQIQQRLYELELGTPVRFGFSDEPDVRRALTQVESPGVRVEVSVPTDFDQSVTQSFGAGGLLEFFQPAAASTINVWVSDAASLRDVIQAIVSRAMATGDATGLVIAENMLNEIGFSWEDS